MISFSVRIAGCGSRSPPTTSRVAVPDICSGVGTLPSPLSTAAPFLYPCIPHCGRSKAKQVIRPRAHNPQGANSKTSISKTRKNTVSQMGNCVFLVAEVGFEPHGLRVMSPTSYQAALLRDIYLRPLLSA